MGAFDNEKSNRPRSRTTTLGGLVCVFTLLGTLSFASMAGANPSDEPIRRIRATAPVPLPTDDSEASVSMSPSELLVARPRASRDAVATDPDDIPLTRAAAQQRVAKMSPVTWLSSFGPVTVGRPR